jgi:alpha-tubulin suppressor-like RCC1 family protein
MEADGATALITARVPGATFVAAAVGAISATARVAVGVPGVGITAGLPSGMEAGYLYGTEIRFEGWGVTQIGEELTGAALVWSSDFDGEFGTGESLTTSALSAGPQRITLIATDAFGLSASAEIEFMIYPAEGPDTVVIAPQRHDFQQVGETFQFQARAYDAGRSEISGARIRWLSADPEIVEIDADGRATARGEGTTQIGAFINTGLDVIEVTVGGEEPHDEIYGIFVQPWRTTIPGLGGPTTLTATAVDHTYENPVPGVVFNWISLDPGIATVDQNGVVTGHMPGTARITAAAGGIESSPVDVYVFEVGPPIAWDTIIAGPWHSCGLARGRAYCWGNNEDGRLGTGDTENRFVPTLVAGGHTFTTIALGGEFTIAIDGNGRAYAWGRNNLGQLGDGTTTDRITPTEVAGGHLFTAISAGHAHAVALTEKGTILTWGNNGNGQLGDDGAPRDNLVPAPVLGSQILGESFTAVRAGYGFTMALRSDSTLHTWGANSNGQLGHGDRTVRRHSPQQVIDQDTQQPLKFTSIDAGDYHAVAIDPNRQGWSWGEGSLGRLGNGSGAVSLYPSRVSGDIEFAWIGAGGSHTLGIATDGTVWGWGEGLQGQLGDGTRDRYNVPTMIAQGFVLLSPGSVHTIGLDAMGMAYVWGWGSNGMLGDGRLEDRNSPVPVLGPVQ